MEDGGGAVGAAPFIQRMLSARKKGEGARPHAHLWVGGGCFAGDLIGLDVKRNLCKLAGGRKKTESQLGVFSIKWLEEAVFVRRWQSR